MEWIEATGKSVNEAVDSALDMLGIHKDEIEYETISEPKKGMFGLGGNEARIRARVKPVSREKPRDKKQRRGNDKRTTSQKKTNTRTNKTKSKPTKKDDIMGDEKIEEQEETPVAEKREYAAPLETQAQYAKDFLGGLVKYFDDSCAIDSNFEEDVINVSVDGKQVGLLIGSRGSTLFAVEELMRAVVQAKVGGYTARMYLDVGGYRAKRKDALADFATNLATKVKETGRVQVLEPMIAADRKIVHDTIAEISGITTTSEGYDPKRRVVVMLEEEAN